MPNPLVRLAVGKKWPGDPAVLAADGVMWQADAGLFVIAIDGLTPAERDTLGGPIDIAVTATGPLVGLMVRFTGWEWQEALTGLRWPTIPEHLRSVPNQPNGHLMLTIVVIERRDGTVARLRTVTLSPHATRVLVREVKDRWTTPLTDQQIMAAAKAWYDAHPTPAAALKDSLARCKAGQ